MKYILFLFLLPLTLFGQSQKISDMTSATTLDGTEYVPIVQTTNKKSTVSLLRGWSSGTANTIAYWPTTSTLGSLSLATYPSLTELSYVKGVTSAIQTQLNSKAGFPAAGIALSTGAAWGTSITNNSANWNTAFGWGNHATAGYELLSNKAIDFSTIDDDLYPSVQAVDTELNTRLNGWLTGVLTGSTTIEPDAANSHHLNIGGSNGFNEITFGLGNYGVTASSSYYLTGSYHQKSFANSSGQGISSHTHTTNSVDTYVLGDVGGSTETKAKFGILGSVPFSSPANQAVMMSHSKKSGASYNNFVAAVGGDELSNTPTFRLYYWNQGGAIPYEYYLNSGNKVFEVEQDGDTRIQGQLFLHGTSQQIVLGTTRMVTITAPTPATTSRTWTIPDLSADQTFVGLTGTQALTNKSVNGVTLVSGGTATLYLSQDGTYTAPSGGGGADALGTYLVQTATNAPANAQVMGSLATGIVKNTTTTGVQSIAVAGDFPTLNQNTTGSAATLTTSRTIGIATGDVTSAGSGFNGSANNTNAYTIANDAVTYAKMQNVSAASKLLGRGDSGSGDVQEITIGSGLTMTGTTLSATGGGTGDVVGPSSSTASTLALFDGATGKLLKEASNATNRVTSDGDDIVFQKVSSVTGNNVIKASNGGSGENHGMGLLLIGGNSTGSNFDGGDVILQSGDPHGSGAKGAIQIADSADKLGFFEVTPVVKQSAASDLQTFYNAIVAYGLMPAATLSGGGGSGLTYAQVSALSVIGN